MTCFWRTGVEFTKSLLQIPHSLIHFCVFLLLFLIPITKPFTNHGFASQHFTNFTRHSHHRDFLSLLRKFIKRRTNKRASFPFIKIRFRNNPSQRPIHLSLLNFHQNPTTLFSSHLLRRYSTSWQIWTQTHRTSQRILHRRFFIHYQQR